MGHFCVEFACAPCVSPAPSHSPNTSVPGDLGMLICRWVRVSVIGCMLFYVAL